MVDDRKSLANEFMEGLTPEQRAFFQKFLRVHNLSESDPMFLALLMIKAETATLENVDALLKKRELELQALLRRIENASSTLCTKADEFVVESDKLRSEIKVSDNITKHVVGINRLRDLNAATSSSSVRLKPLSIIVAASVAAFILGVFVATLLLLLVLR
jgi:hypothetical protein